MNASRSEGGIVSSTTSSASETGSATGDKCSARGLIGSGSAGSGH